MCLQFSIFVFLAISPKRWLTHCLYFEWSALMRQTVMDESENMWTRENLSPSLSRMYALKRAPIRAATSSSLATVQLRSVSLTSLMGATLVRQQRSPVCLDVQTKAAAAHARVEASQNTARKGCSWSGAEMMRRGIFRFWRRCRPSFQACQEEANGSGNCWSHVRPSLKVSCNSILATTVTGLNKPNTS